MAERDFAGVGQRRKRRSVHVNVCMFVHFESIQECLVIFVPTTAHVSGLMHACT